MIKTTEPSMSLLTPALIIYEIIDCANNLIFKVHVN